MNFTDQVSACNQSEYFDLSLFSEWNNVTNFNTSSELIIYICEYKKYMEFYRNISRYISCINILSCIFGLISSILSLITLCKNEYFQAISYSYFRTISTVEILHSVYQLELGLHNVLENVYTHSFVWYWFMNVIGNNIGNASSTICDLLVAFLSVERAAACLSPKIFNKIDQSSVALGVQLGVTVFAFIFFLPQCFSMSIVMDPASGEYSAVVSNYGNSVFYSSFIRFVQSFLFFLAGVIIGTSVLVIIGMLKWLERKRRLLNSVSPNVGQGNEVTEEASKTTLQLCYLQVSQALPTALNYVLYTTYTILYSTVTIGYPAITAGAGFDRAMENLRASYPAAYLLFMVNVSDAIAHCYHFYLYYLLSTRFREGVHERFRKTQASQTSQTNPTTSSAIGTGQITAVHE